MGFYTDWRIMALNSRLTNFGPKIQRLANFVGLNLSNSGMRGATDERISA